MANVVTIQLLDRSFQLKCSPETVEKLTEAGAYLASKMEQLQKAGNTLGYERTAIMAAMDICFELICLRAELVNNNNMINVHLNNLSEKIDAAMAKANIPLSQNPMSKQQSYDI